MRLGGVIVLLVCATSATADEGFFFKDGDRVVVMGDSITEQRLYSNYVELWTLTRYPAWKITFRNVGIGGDRSPGGNFRFDRDVLTHKATALTVDFGMNDGGYRAFDPAIYKTYVDGLQGIADKARKAKVRVAWITPQPIEMREQTDPLSGYNLTLEKLSEGVKELAQKNDGVFVDQFHPYMDVLKKARAADKANTNVTGGDPVHPGPTGQVLMAASILKGLNFPALVSSAEIDATGKKASATKRCKVTDVEEVNGGIRFERLDEALPFFPSEAAAMLKWTPVLTDLNDYRLKVTGLKKGKYTVKLDGTKVHECTGEELAEGLNLAEAVLKAGPIAAQVKAVKKAVEDKTNYYHGRIFRGVILTQASVPEWLGLELKPADIEAKRKKVIEERMAELVKLDEAVSKALAIKPHKVEIVPAE